MQIKEAIEILNVNVLLSPKAFEFKEAVELANNALEKQIPKKPKDYPLSDGQCPTCNAVFDYDWKPKSRFCQNCGQALDWSDT